MPHNAPKSLTFEVISKWGYQFWANLLECLMKLMQKLRHWMGKAQ